jgi:hypothetical protein
MSQTDTEANVETARKHLEQLLANVYGDAPRGNIEARAEMVFMALGGDPADIRDEVAHTESSPDE